LYNALVYVPNGTVQPFPPGVACDRCGTPASGAPLVSTVTAPDGTFTLNNMPTGRDVPLVIQLGRWRRQVVIPNVTACQNTTLPAELTRLPRNHIEGDIPLMAMVTGAVDTLECVLEKIGIDQSEFSVPNQTGGNGRIQIYVGNGVDVAPGSPSGFDLWGPTDRLPNYDMVVLACWGFPPTQLVDNQRRLNDYVNLGGRIFATHYNWSWFFNFQPFQGTANWNVCRGGACFPPDPMIGIIDQTFPKGQAFAEWTQTVGAQVAPGEIEIHQPRHDLDGVIPPSQRWVYTAPPVATVPTIQHYTFNTPIGTPSDQQCGRVVFSDFHVSDVPSPGTTGMLFPTECTPDPLNAQEKLLEFMLFDAASCIQPDMPPPPMCTPRTCAQIGANCGPVGDGCGGMLNCGTCMLPQTCGGGGQPSVCGGMACVPRTCAQQNISCGPAGDGCGGLLQCGMCTAPATCGGGGMPGVCGVSVVDAGACVPRTCAEQNISCGPAGDGCGGQLDCGTCTAPQTCGGGGVHGQCGAPSCTPRTCQQAGANCGPVADGCGGILSCGMCVSPQTCGGGGIPSVCGGACIPETCASQMLSCGMAGDGCGGVIDCGMCMAPMTCGGGGTLGQCGGNNGCTPTTCQAQGANCGPISDGCGEIIDCGTCPAGSICGDNGRPNQCGVKA
jgi:hypothetical protein